MTSNDQPLLTAIFTSNSQQVSQISSATVQRVVPGHSLATSFQSISIDKFLTGAGVDPVAKKRVDEITKDSLAKCDSNNDFAFHTFQVYARPIATIGTHNSSQDNYIITEEDYKQDAEKASKGYHHALIILTCGGNPEPIQYLLDRVEGVRFVKKQMVMDELISGHLILVKEYVDLSIQYKTIKPFILKESAAEYNPSSNNCLTFVYKFIAEVLQKNQWKDDKHFWNFIRHHFNKKDIKKGIYNTQQNHMVKQMSKQNLLYNQKIKLINDEQKRLAWKKGDKINIQSTDFKGIKVWHVGHIITRSEDCIEVKYDKMCNTFCEKHQINSTNVRPYIKVRSSFLDPITKKIMTKPVQLLRSGMIYDEITVQGIKTIEMVVDPITGEFIDTDPVVIVLDDLQQKIQKFIDTHHVPPELINDENSVRQPTLWDAVQIQLAEKFDIKQNQQRIYGQAQTMFYPENESKIDNNSYDNDEKDSFDTDSDESVESDEEDLDILRWNTDNLFINHLSVPLITCIGPSRKGKSFLLCEILRNQTNWKNDSKLNQKNVFEISHSANVALTKGAWITLYGDVESKKDDEKANSSAIALIDNFIEDEIAMWSTDEVLLWINSLNPNFSQTFGDLIKYIQTNKIAGNTLHTLNNMKFLLNIGIKEKDAILLTNILDKRLKKKMDLIDSKHIDQLYFVDSEGLSHQVTHFTKKIFQGCYAISNVMLWFDEDVMSDKFVKLMKKLKKNMKIVATSKRKPAFMYILRNGDRTTFDFGNEDEEKDDFDVYIKSDETFQWFREMNMFSSIHAHLLNAPSLKKNKETGKKYFIYDSDTLNKLVEKIKEISIGTCRFANSAFILNEQIYNINQNNQLSLEKRIALCNSRLKWFVLSAKDKKKRALQIKNAIIKFLYSRSLANKCFDVGYKYLKNDLKHRQLSISIQFDSELMENRDEIFKEIARIFKERRETTKSVGTTTKCLGGTAMAAGLGVFMVSNPVGWWMCASVAGVSGIGAVAGYFWKPKKLDRLINKTIEINITELQYYGNSG
eukprot:143906_1